ncbi:elongator complex protein 4, partial [Lecanoromycetidae sp. Uapishka_2]
MSFRKRNVGLVGPSSEPRQGLSSVSQPEPTKASGVRPSPLDGRPTTSTGTQTLDDILAGHGGLALGNSLLIEENGTTDFAGALLRFYAAEGIAQGHQVHVVGFGEQWGRGLPGLTGAVDGGKETSIDVDREKMKIAWSAAHTNTQSAYTEPKPA